MPSNTRMVDADGFALAVWEILQEMNSSVDTALTDTLKTAAKETAKNVRQLSPRRPGLPARSHASLGERSCHCLQDRKVRFKENYGS